MPKRLNPNLAKIHRSYSVEEVAGLFGVHKNTVRAWIKAGMPVCDECRPTLILGHHLRSYLQAKRQVTKRKCKPFEMYCLRCRMPRRPAGDMVDFEPLNESTGRLTGICPNCDALMNRYASAASLAKISGYWEVRTPKAQQHINERDIPLLNSDFSRRP